MDDTEARDRVLAAAARLFYARGIQSVSMDELRAEGGLSLKRMYKLFPSKDALVAAVLAERSREWTAGISERAARVETPREKLLAIYDFLSDWFTQDDFRGCAFINSFGELGSSTPTVAEAARRQKEQFQEYVSDLVREAGGPPSLAPQLAILAEGAQTTAAISGTGESAAQARAAAETLITVALAA